MTQSSGTTRGQSHHSLRRWAPKIVVALVVALIGNLILLIREAQEGNDDRLARLKSLERRVNPFMLRFAGTLPWGLARLDHRGRRSGRFHTTPLLAEPVHGGFMIGMPYGSGADWAQNLIAEGGGVLQHNGARFQLSNPRIVSVAKARPDLPPSLRLMTWILGIRNVMRVDATPAASTQLPLPA